MIYEPSEDSFLLQTWVRRLAQGRVLDMGCGSGIQARTALSVTGDVVACDIDPEAVAYCTSQKINAVVSDLFSNVSGVFDLIIFNPPYLPAHPDEDSESSLITAGGTQGYELLERFFRDAAEHLAPKGKILFVCSSLTGDVEALMDLLGYKFLQMDSSKHFFEELKVYTAWL